MRSFKIGTPQGKLGNQIKGNNRIGGARRTLGAGGGGRIEIHTGFWWGNLKETDYLEDPGVGEKMILK
jgi:hypothetical protein